jgi:hypothetical protein
MFYYIEVFLLAHYIQRIKMHGETVKKVPVLCLYLALAETCRRISNINYQYVLCLLTE